MIEQHSRPYLSPILSDHHPAIYGEARGPVPRLAGQAWMQSHLFLSSPALSQSAVESDHSLKIAILGKADFHRRPLQTRTGLCASTYSAIFALELKSSIPISSREISVPNSFSMYDNSSTNASESKIPVCTKSVSTEETFTDSFSEKNAPS